MQLSQFVRHDACVRLRLADCMLRLFCRRIFFQSAFSKCARARLHRDSHMLKRPPHSSLLFLLLWVVSIHVNIYNIILAAPVPSAFAIVILSLFCPYICTFLLLLLLLHRVPLPVRMIICIDCFFLVYSIWNWYVCSLRAHDKERDRSRKSRVRPLPIQLIPLPTTIYCDIYLNVANLLS